MATKEQLVCVKNGQEVKRITKYNAQLLVNSGKWTFCPKSEWKAQQRQTKK